MIHCEIDRQNVVRRDLLPLVPLHAADVPLLHLRVEDRIFLADVPPAKIDADVLLLRLRQREDLALLPQCDGVENLGDFPSGVHLRDVFQPGRVQKLRGLLQRLEGVAA